MRKSPLLIFAVALLLSACANEKGIRVLARTGDGPDEFAIVPGKPLATPESYASLPEPTPGGTNLTDQNPIADATSALGGRADVASADGSYPSNDGALVSYASRMGVSTSIRADLESDDAKIRRQFERFTQFRLARSDRYNEVYRRYHLDPYRELARWRRLGVKTPTAPVPQS
jgi:hypothetical protein